MRHRDPKQTAKTDTDARMLPLKEAVQKLSFHLAEMPRASDTQIDTQTPAASGHLLSNIVTLPVSVESGKKWSLSEGKVTDCHIKSRSVRKWENGRSDRI